MKQLISAVLLIVVLSSCSSLTVEDCAMTDWQARGFDEGKRGFSLKQYDEYAQECKEIGGVIPPKSKYTTGHYKGTLEFCTATSGYAFGKNGGYYRHSCREWNLNPTDFLDGYNAGKEIYAAEKKLDETIEELEDHRTSMDDAQYQIRWNTDKLSDPELTEKDRRTAQIEIEKQRSRYGDLYRSEHLYEEDIEEAKRDLEYIILKHERLNYCDYEGCFEK
ncbi:DUF2799 domain-containing protein [Kangiella sp. HZ709]|uniref:DUF2799 domain-containing protein n=1 Tax=Kangiella sp. HZ709 TaxID=2666328 RepID=UPI0018A22382|nr:DUF2799 domain-containing protein [Kangiella sp. HZ709]